MIHLLIYVGLAIVVAIWVWHWLGDPHEEPPRPAVRVPEIEDRREYYRKLYARHQAELRATLGREPTTQEMIYAVYNELGIERLEEIANGEDTTSHPQGPSGSDHHPEH